MGVFGDWAKKYYESGYVVLPVEPGTKACTIKGWNRIFTKGIAESELDNFIETHGDWWLGLVCGNASNICAVDFDWDGEHHDIYENMILGVLPITPVGKMGAKKWTRFYQNHKSLKLRHIKYLKTDKNFLDIITDGPGYTILPPSPHKNGGELHYKWLYQDSLLDMPATDLPTITEDDVKKLEEISKISPNDIHSISSPGSTRNDTLFGFTWRQSDSCQTFDELISKVLQFDEVRYSKTKKGCFFGDKKYAKNMTKEEHAIKDISRWIDYKARKRKDSGVEWSIGSDVSHPFKSAGFFSMHVSEKGKVTETPEYIEMAEYLYKVLHLRSNDSVSYIYKDTHYETIDTYALKKLILDLTKGKCKSTHSLASFLEFAKVRSNAFFDHGGISNLINLKNGILNLTTKELLSHTPNIFFKYVLPHSFDPGSECPRWLEFLDFVFEGNQELIAVSAEIFGYVIAGGTPWLHKAFFLEGSGRNGKSTWLEVLKALLGATNYCSIPLKALDKPFSVVMADGKSANIVGELDSKDLSSEAFKMAVGGEELIAAHKGKPEYALKFLAKIIVATNNPVNFKDTSPGSYERLYILPFNKFIPEGERDRTVLDKLLTELPGILNWSLVGLDRLLQRGHLPKIEAVETAIKEHRANSDTVFQWHNEFVQYDNIDENNTYLVASFYESYSSFCQESGTYSFSKIRFCRELIREIRRNISTSTKISTGGRTSIKGKLCITAKMY